MLDQGSRMYRGSARYFKVVSDPDGHYAVWFADAPRHKPWSETGRYGSEDDCWDYVESAESSEGYVFQFPIGS